MEFLKLIAKRLSVYRGLIWIMNADAATIQTTTDTVAAVRCSNSMATAHGLCRQAFRIPA